MRAGKWQRNIITESLTGKTLGVLGLGRLGKHVARYGQAFGMNVIGVDPEDIPIMPIISKVVKPDQLNEVLPQADVVFVSAPHTAQSHKMMGAKEFDLMKKNSYFIAVSRGGIYDMNGLVKALDSQNIVNLTCSPSSGTSMAFRTLTILTSQSSAPVPLRVPSNSGTLCFRYLSMYWVDVNRGFAGSISSASGSAA